MDLTAISRRLLSGNASRTALASYFAFFSAAVCGLISIPVAVAYLDKSALGLWAVINAAVTYLLWMDLGVGEATGRKMADAVAESDQQEINRWWTTTRVVLLVQGLLVACCGVLLLEPFLRFFEVPDWQRSEASWLFCGTAATAGFSMPLRGVPGLMVAQQRAYWTGVWQGTSPWVSLVSFYVFLRMGWGLTAYLASTLVTQATTWLFYSALIRTGPQIPRWDLGGITKGRISSLFRFSMSLSLMGIIDSFASTLPALVLGRYGGLAQVPIYTFTSKFPLLIVSLVNRTIWAFYPGFLRDYVGRGAVGLPAKHLAVSLIVTSIGLFVAGGAFVFNETLVTLLAGRDFYAGPLVSSLLVATILIEPGCHLFRFLIHLSGSAGFSSVVAAINLVVVTILAVVGYKTFGLPGLAGAGLVLPLPLAFYGLVHGARKCGLAAGTLSKAGPVIATTGVAVIALAGWMSQQLTPSTLAFTLFGRELLIPLGETWLMGAVLWTAGGIIGFRALRSYPNKIEQ